MFHTPLAALVRKDLQLFASDRRALVMTFAVPIVIASFFGAIFSGQGGDAGAAAVPVLIVDQDGSAISARVIKSLAEDRSFAVRTVPLDEARRVVRSGDATAAVVIPKGFGDAAGRAFFGTGSRPQVDLLVDPSKAPEVGMVRGLLTSHVMESVSAEMFGGRQGRALIDETLTRLGDSDLSSEQQRLLRDLLTSTRDFYDRTGGTAAGEASPALRVPFSLREEAMTAAPGTSYNAYAHAFAGMGVQFVLFAAIDLGIGILVERQRGLWKRLRSAPLSRFQLLLGKFVSGAIVATMSLTAAFTFAILVFGVRIEGSIIGFVAVVAACAAMAAGFGLMLAALGRTPNATRGIAILATLIMVMLGGAWVPTFVFPPWLQQVTLVVPTRWAVDGLDAMTWRGLGLGAAVAPIAVMVGFAAIFGFVALRRFRWEEA
jgi:ABC-2 type transport system permease protein